jgi:hypothetical protein
MVSNISYLALKDVKFIYLSRIWVKNRHNFDRFTEAEGSLHLTRGCNIEFFRKIWCSAEKQLLERNRGGK